MTAATVDGADEVRHLRSVAGTLRGFLRLVYVAGCAVLVYVVDDWAPAVAGDEPVEWDEMLGLVALALMLVVAHRSRRVVVLQRALRQEADDLADKERHVLATSREWIWSMSATGTFLSSSTAVARILGREPRDVVGLSLLDLLHPEDRAATARRLMELSEGGEGWTGWVRRWQHADGSYRWLESDALPVHAESGALAGFRGADRDVTGDVVRRQQSDDAQAETAAKRARIQAVLDDPTSLTMVFQPIVRLDDGAVAGAEALSRFHGSAQRTPDVWFAEAAEIGLGEQLEILAVRAGLAALDATGDAYVSVNVSPATLVSPALIAALTGRGVACERVVVELTEHVEIARYDDLRDALAALRRVGVRIAVDDAGAGYASFQHILELRPDFIKLDRGIVRGVATDPVRRALAAAVAEFARDIDATVVAEGVENADEVLALRAAGVTCGQGYYFAPPGPLPIPVIAAPPRDQGRRIVVVDDDPVVRLLVTAMARRAGLDVAGQASDGAEGLALVRVLRPDVVVLDLSMPVLDGAAALPHVRALVPAACVVVLSGRTDADTVAHALANGADVFVAKADSATKLREVFQRLGSTSAAAV